MEEILRTINTSPFLIILISSIFGYLIGSVSFARVVHFMVKRTTEIEPFAEAVPHSDEIFESDLVSATLVSKKIGKKWGCLTSILDLLKVAIPVLLVKYAWPEEPYFLITAIFGVIGHNYPLYHGFIGGRGESSILGILLVINWFGLIITNAAGFLLSFITGSVLVMRYAGYVLMIFWYWIYFKDIRYVIFMALIVFLLWLSMRKDLARFSQLKTKKGLSFSEEDVSEFILMGKSPGKMLDKNSLYSLWKKKHS